MSVKNEVSTFQRFGIAGFHCSIHGHLMHHIWLAQQAANLPHQNFAGHSFWIGAATTAAKSCIENSKDTCNRSVEQFCILVIHLYSQGRTVPSFRCTVNFVSVLFILV